MPPLQAGVPRGGGRGGGSGVPPPLPWPPSPQGLCTGHTWVGGTFSQAAWRLFQEARSTETFFFFFKSQRKRSKF